MYRAFETERASTELRLTHDSHCLAALGGWSVSHRSVLVASHKARPVNS